jgi:hypothetical protein
MFLWRWLDRSGGLLQRVQHRAGPEFGIPRLVRCEMRAGGGVGAGTLGADPRLGLLDDGHYLGLPHVVYGFRHFGGDGWKFAGKTLIERLFCLEGGAIKVVGATAVAEAHGWGSDFEICKLHSLVYFDRHVDGFDAAVSQAAIAARLDCAST